MNHRAYLENAIEQVKNNPVTDCVIWPFTKNKSCDGYGQVKYGDKIVLVHRLAYQLYYGKEPENMVLHKCGNAACYNPLHLYEGTPKDNTRDMIEDWGYHPGGRRKLTEKDVIEIIELLKRGINQDEIGARYHVTHAAISNINTGKTWQHIPRSGKPPARTRRSPKTGIVMQYNGTPGSAALRKEKTAPRLTPRQLKVIRGLWSRGFSYREIAYWLSVKRSEIKELVAAHSTTIL